MGLTCGILTFNAFSRASDGCFGYLGANFKAIFIEFFLLNLDYRLEIISNEIRRNFVGLSKSMAINHEFVEFVGTDKLHHHRIESNELRLNSQTKR